MRVNAIGTVPRAYGAVKNSQNNNQELSLKGYRVHVLDGGLHADLMNHFAKALRDPELDTFTKLIFHNVETLPKNQGLKNLKSLKENLLKLEQDDSLRAGDFLAIPITAPIELNRLAYGYAASTGWNVSFTPQNIKSKKDIVMRFLEKPSETTLERIDPEKQGFEHIVGIIQSVNRFVKKGVNVYIPADHPLEAAIKWKAGEMGIKDDLYRYISTGIDQNGQIGKIIADLKAKNAYKFNLLTLSDAHIVNLQNRTETGDYIFSAYDSCVTDRARGVYNFCPVRRAYDGVLMGYSFTDKTSVHYPYHEYPKNEEIANIAHFVGRKPSDFSYEGNIIHIMKSLIEWEEPRITMPNVPYPVDQIYSPTQIYSGNLLAKGKYTDRTETLFFDLNNDQELIFRRCDCEGSGRPSVASMWGSCFATINLMTRNVRTQLKNLFEVTLPEMMRLAKKSEEVKDYAEAEKILQKALKLSRPEVGENGASQIEYDIATQLADVYVKQGKIDDVERLMYETIPDRYPDKRGNIEYRIRELRRNLANDNA